MSNADVELVFKADSVPALGFKSYTLQRANSIYRGVKPLTSKVC